MIRKLMILSLIVVLPSLLYANNEGLSQRLSPIKTMQADFTQMIYDNHGTLIQKSKGHMLLYRPGKFRWEVTSPIPQLIIANDTRLWIYDKDLEQVTVRRLDKLRGETPALLLSHVNQALDEDFNIQTLATKKPDWAWFKLVPKNPDSMFAMIKMGFLKQQLKAMDLKDHLDHTTRILFSKVVINGELDPHLFLFKPSKSVDVIDETQNR